MDESTLQLVERIKGLETGMAALTDRVNRHCEDQERTIEQMRDTFTAMLAAQLERFGDKLDMLGVQVDQMNKQLWRLVFILAGAIIAAFLAFAGLKEFAPKLLGL